MYTDTEFDIKFSRMVLVQNKNKAESLKLAGELWRNYSDLISVYFLDYDDLVNWIIGMDDLSEAMNKIKL